MAPHNVSHSHKQWSPLIQFVRWSISYWTTECWCHPWPMGLRILWDICGSVSDGVIWDSLPALVPLCSVVCGDGPFILSHNNTYVEEWQKSTIYHLNFWGFSKKNAKIWGSNPKLIQTRAALIWPLMISMYHHFKCVFSSALPCYETFNLYSMFSGINHDYMAVLSIYVKLHKTYFFSTHLLKISWNTAWQNSYMNTWLDMLGWHEAPIKPSQVFIYFNSPTRLSTPLISQ